MAESVDAELVGRPEDTHQQETDFLYHNNLHDQPALSSPPSALDASASVAVGGPSGTNGTPPGGGCSPILSVEPSRHGRVFDIVLQSPTTSGPVAANSVLTSPATPSVTSSSMTSSMEGGSCINGSGTVCFGDERQMLTDLGRRFFNHRVLSDVRLRVGDRVFRCHKLILARASDVLERMLCSTEWNDASKQVEFQSFVCLNC